MTTVAWDGKALVADRQCSYHGTPVCKVMRLPNGALVGLSGDYDAALSVFEYLADRASKPELGDVRVTAMLVTPEGVSWMHNRLVAMPVNLPFFAIGSGADYAMGAMAMGATAAQAVAIAARYDEATGTDTDTLTLEP